MTKSRTFALDPVAKSTSSPTPAFLAEPIGSSVYHGYVVIPETYIDGWVLGEVTPYLGEESGDGFVVAPDGTQASLIWELGEGDLTEIMPGTPERWGVYAVFFPRAMRTLEDLIENFNSALPSLRAAHARVTPSF